MEKGGEPLKSDDKPNFYQYVFGRALTLKDVEGDRYNHHFWVEDIDVTLALAQQYIDEYGGWKILLPKTLIAYGFIAALAVDTDNNQTDTPDLIFIDQDPTQANNL